MYYIGVDVGGTNLVAGLMNEDCEILDKASWCNKDMYYMLGVIYGQGLGVAADIPKAVGYLQKAGDLKEAKEELLHYKKSLFGKWVRR